MTDSSDYDSPSTTVLDNSTSPNLTSDKDSLSRTSSAAEQAPRSSDEETSTRRTLLPNVEDRSRLQLYPKESTLDADMPERELRLFDLVEEQKKQLEEYHAAIQKLEASNSVVMQNCKELENKYEHACKQKENAIKEKESMVVKYAMSEKSVIKQQTAKDNAEKRAKELQREHDLLQHKLTMMTNEKARICQLLDNKSYELKSSQQEAERLKTDLGALETKLKWTQNNLKTEIELRKDVEAKLESLQAQVQDYVNEAEKAKKDADETIKEFHMSQDNRAFVLETQSKEQQASLILLRHELDDRDQQIKTLQQELDKFQRKQNDSLQENNALSVKVQKLETERNEMEMKLAEFRNCIDEQRQNAADLSSKSSQVEKLKLQLQSEQDQLQAAQDEIEVLRVRNADLTIDMEACRAHETELLGFTQQLTDKNVSLQSEFTTMETKVQQLSYENGVLNRRVQEHETKSGLTVAQLHAERKKMIAEIEKLQHELEVARMQVTSTAQELADQQGENFVLKRKHELSLREVNKELSHVRKKVEQYESRSTASSSSSTTSLNTVERNGSLTPPPPPSHVQTLQIEHVQVIQPEMPLDRHVLIEHIAKLQRVSAKKSEKLDFMEEHVRTLVGELQKKSRLLQHYIKREQQGTLSSDKMDHNKAGLAKQTGIMASMYSAKVSDEHLTIEQVLEINRKLYSILEDALLKNITLKDNIDTLGLEIDKLRKPSTSAMLT